MLQQTDISEATVSLLLNWGVVDEAAVERARRAANVGDTRLDLALARLGLAAERQLAKAYAKALQAPLIGPDEFPEEEIDVGLTRQFMERYRVAPLAVEDRRLSLAMADPLDTFVIRAVEMKTSLRVNPHVIYSADFDAAFKRLYDDASEDADDIVDIADVARLKDMASDAPVIKLVDQIITGAIERRASDIHFAPRASGLRIRYRIDGALVDADTPPNTLRAAIVSRLKIMAGLDIAETRLPQDGRIRIVARGRDVDLRISIMPSIDGEGVVVRILDHGGARPDLKSLGLSDHGLERLAGLLDLPHGVTIVTGPTGSGKTTTLYAALQRLNRADRHIATIEDPVEYRLEGVNQIQVRPEIGFDFADALRHLLRHDPDVVMIGEIRDAETAKIGLQSALTGHPVLATLHTNDAISALPRLLDMGVEAYLAAAVVNGVVAQRLVRKLCLSCRKECVPPDEILARLGGKGLDNVQFFTPVGCEACGETGYHGRTVIAEVLRMTAEMKAALVGAPDLGALSEAAHKDGLRPLFEDGLLKAAAGETSLDEIFRVAGESGSPGAA